MTRLHIELKYALTLGRSPTGDWIVFTGDQLGTLFASWILNIYRSSCRPIGKLAMVASTVSSKMIGTIAASEGFKFMECLTGLCIVFFTLVLCKLSKGFKFIGNTALDLAKDGFEVPFGYEEAIGFMFGSEIRDKDGVAATVSKELVASMLSWSIISLLGNIRGDCSLLAQTKQDCHLIPTGVI